MHPLPHHYNVTVTASETGPAEIYSPGLNPLISEPPPEFGGPGDLWSPETMTVAAVADCLVLTFRAIANASQLRWSTLVCDAIGTVDRSEGMIRFTGFQMRARLVVFSDVDGRRARKLLEKAEKVCLVGNSLKIQPVLEVEVTVEKPALSGV